MNAIVTQPPAAMSAARGASYEVSLDGHLEWLISISEGSNGGVPFERKKVLAELIANTVENFMSHYQPPVDLRQAYERALRIYERAHKIWLETPATGNSVTTAWLELAREDLIRARLLCEAHEKEASKIPTT